MVLVYEVASMQYVLHDISLISTIEPPISMSICKSLIIATSYVLP